MFASVLRKLSYCNNTKQHRRRASVRVGIGQPPVSTCSRTLPVSCRLSSTASTVSCPSAGRSPHLWRALGSWTHVSATRAWEVQSCRGRRAGGLVRVLVVSRELSVIWAGVERGACCAWLQCAEGRWSPVGLTVITTAIRDEMP